MHACDINIMNSKWDSGKKIDGNYIIYFDSKLLEEKSAEQCELAKKHLLKLLIDGRCPLNVESDRVEAPSDNGTDNDSK